MTLEQDIAARAEAARVHVLALVNERRFVEAVEPAAEVCRLLPKDGGAWWNYAVALKHAHRWADCLDACERAIEIDPDDAEGMHWNAGIAASALGRWPRARDAWRACRLEIPDGDGPPKMKLGLTPIRVAVETDPEVVWCDRIDPCRAIIRSVPLPEAERSFGDLVLHDGEPRGERFDGRRTLDVFDELAVLEASSYGTWEVVADCPDEAARDALAALFDDVDGAIEDWTESVRTLCGACSRGEEHDHHEAASAREWETHRRFGVAVRADTDLRRLRRTRRSWRDEVVSVERVR